MACFTSYLQLTSWIVHEAKIHDVIYEDLKFLWDQGVEVFDDFSDDNFEMHANFILHHQ